MAPDCAPIQLRLFALHGFEPCLEPIEPGYFLFCSNDDIWQTCLLLAEVRVHEDLEPHSKTNSLGEGV